ncbi:MAG: hypothetical protein IJJ26_08525 [Victivallales bacterium]|nr:hypothetical protein [Victivallales bacterium]
MKLYNLRWNPSISSFRDSTFRMGFERLIKGQYTGLNWSLWESEELEPGDWCLLSRVGSGSDGVVAVGRFVSYPYLEESWSKGTKKKIPYADFEFYLMQEPEETGVLTASELAQLCPEVDWHHGHSGIKLPVDAAECLAIRIADIVLARYDSPGSPSFAIAKGHGPRAFLCAMLSSLCPKLHQTLQKKAPATPALEENWLPDYGDEILIDEDKVRPGTRIQDVARVISWKGVYRIQE